ncbi:MAG: hypothetical protein NDJ89_01295 [Oligoflexia bacterium]|nr:hypothetical protein [Oligoflexia bacterium]
MRIQLTKNAVCGKVQIPKADYWVSLNSDSGQILLSAGGKDLRLPAVKRRSQVRTRSTTVSFYSGGGPLWSLVISTPKYGEWIATIEYKDD